MVGLPRFGASFCSDFDQILSRYLARLLTRVLGKGIEITKYSVQFAGAENTVHSPTGSENPVCSFTGTEAGYMPSTTVIAGPFQKIGYPLTTNQLVKRYMFVNDQRISMHM